MSDIPFISGAAFEAPEAPIPPEGANSYVSQLLQLLPRGAAWPTDVDATLRRAMEAIADELTRIGNRALDLITESDPRTAVETLPEWEQMLGIPDDCLQELPVATEERQAAIVQRLISRGGQTPALFVEIAEALGFHGATVEEYRFAQLRVGFRAGDRSTGNSWAFAWRMNLPSAAPGRLAVECVIRRAAPAHTTVVFSYA